MIPTITMVTTFFNENNEIFLLTICLGSLFIGSFLNVIIYRLPQMMQQAFSEDCRIYLGLKPNTETANIGLCFPFSHCTHCKKTIRPWHNIPLISFLWLRGRCNYCHGKISFRYPLVELATCLMSTYVAWKLGLSIQTLFALFFTYIAICLTFIDIDHHLLPDQLTLLLLWISLFASLFNVFCSSYDAIIGAIIGYLVFAGIQGLFGLITGKIGMGQGDYKFLAAIGATVGFQLLPLIILIASVSGVICALMHMSIKKYFKSIPLPFGPYLALAGWIALLWGNEIMHFYLNFINSSYPY